MANTHVLKTAPIESVQGVPKSDPLVELSLHQIENPSITRDFLIKFDEKKHLNIIGWC